jgi:hypothetical protein
VLEVLRKQLRCKSIWIEGAYRYRNPDEDLPGDWDTRREYYYQLLGLPMDATDFVKTRTYALTAQYFSRLPHFSPQNCFPIFVTR